MQAGSHGWKTEVTKKVEKVWSDACAPRNWFWCSFPFSPPPLSCCRAAATVGALCQSREWEVFPLLPKTQWEHRQKPLLFCLFSQHSCLPREACPVSTSKESSSSRKRGVGKKICITVSRRVLHLFLENTKLIKKRLKRKKKEGQTWALLKHPYWNSYELWKTSTASTCSESQIYTIGSAGSRSAPSNPRSVMMLTNV